MEGSSSPHEDVGLPESVERSIRRICEQKQLPPLKNCARKMLSLIGEQASVKILNSILLTDTHISFFSAYVSTLVEKDYPSQAGAVLSVYRPRTPSRYSSPHTLNGESSQSPLPSFPVNSPNLRKTASENSSCKLSFEDETQDQRISGIRDKSSHAREFGETTEPATISPQMMILNKLEYRKLLLVLSYMGRQKLEAVITLDGANEVCGMKDLPMRDFETEIWSKYGQKFCDKSDRSQYRNWDSGKTHMYYSHVCGNGSYYFKGPYLNSSRTHLQRSLGDDNILIVKFEDGAHDTSKIAEEGIFVGLRHYRFFVFKDERNKVKKNQIEEDKKAAYSGVKCYFVHIDSVLYRKSISEARRMFMHIHTLRTIEKYMARFSLILSKTTKLEVNLAAVVRNNRRYSFPSMNMAFQFDFVYADPSCQSNSLLYSGCKMMHFFFHVPYFLDENGSIIHDEDGKPIWHTHGTGYISEDLAIQRSRDLYAAKCKRDSSSEIYDQFANFEDITCQGASYTEPPLLMQCRLFHYGKAVKGTLLVDRKLDPGTIQIRPSMIKVEKDPSQTLEVKETFDSLESVTTSKRPGRNYLSKYLIALLSYGGVPKEFFLNLLANALEETRNVYSDKRAALRVTAGQISGKVLVYWNPGMHFGDIHIMEAMYVKELEEVVGNAKFGIFFSFKGQSSAAYKMATGDFDGDKYWVSRNPELLKYFKASEPWSRVYSVPNLKKKVLQEFSEPELERQLFELFLEAMEPSFSMGIAANSWLAYMDRLLTLGDDCASEKSSLKEKMIQLVDIYYAALDAPKSGKKAPVPGDLRAGMFPHGMEKGPDISYHSSSILGQIYDRVQEFRIEAVLKIEIWKLPCFDVSQTTERDVSMWKARYEDYRKEMRIALESGDESKNDAANKVIKKYKQILYDAPDMEESRKDTQEIHRETIAIYHVTYDYAMSHDVEKCSFAWRVAGSALCDFCARKLAGPKEKPLTISPSVLRAILN